MLAPITVSPSWFASSETGTALFTVEEFIAEELADVAVELPDHRRLESPGSHRIAPVNRPLAGCWIEQAEGDGAKEPVQNGTAWVPRIVYAYR